MCDPMAKMSVFIRTQMNNYYLCPHSVKLISVAVRTQTNKTVTYHKKTGLIFPH